MAAKRKKILEGANTQSQCSLPVIHRFTGRSQWDKTNWSSLYKRISNPLRVFMLFFLLKLCCC